jgi:hypothetical protein
MGLYVVIGLVVVLSTLYLWRSRPEDDSRSNLPPGLLPTGGDPPLNQDDAPSDAAAAGAKPGAQSKQSKQSKQTRDAEGPPAPVSGSRVQAAGSRLAHEPSYRIDKEHEDCQILIRAGVQSLHALYAAVVGKADSWVDVYPAMAVVADGLGPAGYEVVAQLLADAVEQHHSRMISFLDYAISDMDSAICAALCARVNAECAAAFGEAAAHHDEEAFEQIVARLQGAPKENSLALRGLLAAFLSSSSLTEHDLWKGALRHANPQVRAAAALAARDRGSEPKLLALADDPDESVRSALLVGAEEIPQDTLLRLTRDPSPRVRATACWELEGGSTAVLQTYKRLLDDPHPAVALMAAVGLDGVADEKPPDGAAQPALDDRLQAALASSDPLLREMGAQVAGFLSPAKYCVALRQLSQVGSPDEVAAAITCADDEPEVLSCIAEVMAASPAMRVLRAGEIQLAFSDGAGAVDAAARLLAPELPARVRRAGFYAMTPHRDAWPQQLEPLLREEEPLLADLINELEGALVSDDPVDASMFKRIKSRYRQGPLAELADKALKRT